MKRIASIYTAHKHSESFDELHCSFDNKSINLWSTGGNGYYLIIRCYIPSLYSVITIYLIQNSDSSLIFNDQWEKRAFVKYTLNYIRKK